MELLATVLFALAVALSLATLFLMFLALAAQNEIEKSDCIKIGENTVEVFANCDNMEYYIRCILLVYMGTDVQTVIYLNPESRHFEDELAIAETFAGKNSQIHLKYL